jgi:hypothetical protein
VKSERGQASIEFLGGLPTLLLAGLVAFQLLAVGYASVTAGSAAEAGALAMAAGTDPKAGVLESLPGWSRARARISASHGRVRVTLQPPSPLRMVARQLEVTAEAAVNAP